MTTSHNPRCECGHPRSLHWNNKLECQANTCDCTKYQTRKTWGAA